MRKIRRKGNHYEHVHRQESQHEADPESLCGKQHDCEEVRLLLQRMEHYGVFRADDHLLSIYSVLPMSEFGNDMGIIEQMLKKICESEVLSMVEKAKKMTIAEMVEQYDFIEAVLNIPERKMNPHIVTSFADDYGPGRHNKFASADDAGYGYLYAELCRERDAEKAKVRNRRKADRKHPENKAERKKNEIRRIRKLYGNVWEDGFGWFYENGKTGSKKSTEKDAEIFRNLREKSIAESMRKDEEAEHRVGFNTVQRLMYNADKRMREIRAEVADSIYVVDTYDDCYVVIYPDGMGYQHPYPDEYYNEKATWEGYEYMIRKYGMEYANKYAKGECY